VIERGGPQTGASSRENKNEEVRVRKRRGQAIPGNEGQSRERYTAREKTENVSFS
jgi:hypothetical protein